MMMRKIAFSLALIASLLTLPDFANAANDIYPPVRSGNFTGPAPVTVTTSPTLLVAARIGTPGTGRVGVAIICAATVALGGSGVTFAGSPQLPAGSSIMLPVTAAVYAIATGSSTVCNAWEVY